MDILDYDKYTDPVPSSMRSLKVNGEIIRTSEDVENS